MDKPLVWLHGEVSAPPLSASGRLRMGGLLRRLQGGELLRFPHSRPMGTIGARCHELRVVDQGSSWRLVYRIDADAIVIAEVFRKTSRETPASVIEACRRRLCAYDCVGEERG